MMFGGLRDPDYRPHHLLPFGVIAAVKLAGWAVKLLFSFCYRPDAPEHSGEHFSTPYLAAHTTLVCPVLSPSLPALKLALCSWVASRPSSILIVASVNEIDKIERAVNEALSTYPDGRFVCRIRVLEADPGAGKRDKMMAGVEACEASTEVVVFVDDDVTWPPSMLRWLLKPFERRNVGGVGTSQAMRPLREDGAETSWEVLADMRLTQRFIDVAASQALDGGCQCLSGRTAAYRHQIVADPVFKSLFLRETWRGVPLQSGDDKFITRWLARHDWDVQMQLHPDCTAMTTFRPDATLLLQLLRWSRNTWRSDLRWVFGRVSLCGLAHLGSQAETTVWRRHPLLGLILLEKMTTPLTFAAGAAVAVHGLTYSWPLTSVLLFLGWLFLSRAVRLLPHFARRPSHLLYLPDAVLFAPLLSALRVYALCTLRTAAWYTRGRGGCGSSLLYACDHLVLLLPLLLFALLVTARYFAVGAEWPLPPPPPPPPTSPPALLDPPPAASLPDWLRAAAPWLRGGEQQEQSLVWGVAALALALACLGSLGGVGMRAALFRCWRTCRDKRARRRWGGGAVELIDEPRALATAPHEDESAWDVPGLSPPSSRGPDTPGQAPAASPASRPAQSQRARERGGGTSATEGEEMVAPEEKARRNLALQQVVLDMQDSRTALGAEQPPRSRKRRSLPPNASQRFGWGQVSRAAGRAASATDLAARFTARPMLSLHPERRGAALPVAAAGQEDEDDVWTAAISPAGRRTAASIERLHPSNPDREAMPSRPAPQPMPPKRSYEWGASG
mmetsp:Transcript_8704/g.27581  ORF Transcript_8704/g.27581 Transcript_8704/m.27581 type:complete len:788 (+) Transcript_8704:44-2407(+)